MLGGAHREQFRGLQAAEDGVEGGFGYVHVGLHVLDDLIPIGFLVLDGRQHADIQQAAFQLYVHGVSFRGGWWVTYNTIPHTVLFVKGILKKSWGD